MAVSRRGGVLAWLTALLLVGAFVAWAYVQVRSAPGYGTDELAFDQYAGLLARHGLDPYVHSMASSFSMFRVSPDGYTYSLAGVPVTQLSYPALAFLIYLPFLALGWSTQLAVVLNVLAWAVTVLLIFALLPRNVRPAALLIGSVGVYVSYAVGGITDVLYMPLLVLAAYRWDQFGRSRRSYLGPVMLGLAMAIKQTPWLLLPFILCALAMDEHARAGTSSALKRCGRYLAAVAVAFLLPNIPYIVASPGKWFHGVATPIVSHLVPAGQGAVALSLFLHVGGGSLAAYTIASVVLTLLMLALYLGTYPLLRPATFILPAVVLFFASRSYGNYLVSLVPVALVGAVTITAQQPPAARPSAPSWPGPWALVRTRGWAAAILAGAALFAAAVVYALTAGQPLRLRVAGIRTTGQLATIEQLTVHVTNTSGSGVRPSFTVGEGSGVTTFWHITQGPRTLAADASADYKIVAPNFPSQPSIAGGFVVVAFSQGPAAVSASGTYEPSTTHVALTPNAVNEIIPVGQPVVVHAELLDQLDRPVHKGNVPVYLGQIIYDQSGLELSEATINSRAPGQTPVLAYTDNDGVATFTLVGTQAASDPIYFEANLVQSSEFYPYGYSEILPIRFRAP
jgi:heme/copper-type cytochrome/quinol oxidase subunit 4